MVDVVPDWCPSIHSRPQSLCSSFACFVAPGRVNNTNAVKFIVGAHLLCPLASRDLFCAGHGITWSCPYSPLAKRGTQQPFFSFVCPGRVFCVGVIVDHTVVLYGNAGSAALFSFWGAALFIFSWTILTWIFGTLWIGTSRNPKLF